MYFSEEQSIENNSNMILTHILILWNEKKSSSHARANALAPVEHVVLDIFPIELKLYCFIS